MSSIQTSPYESPRADGFADGTSENLVRATASQERPIRHTLEAASSPDSQAGPMIEFSVAAEVAAKELASAIDAIDATIIGLDEEVLCHTFGEAPANSSTSHLVTSPPNEVASPELVGSNTSSIFDVDVQTTSGSLEDINHSSTAEDAVYRRDPPACVAAVSSVLDTEGSEKVSIKSVEIMGAAAYAEDHPVSTSPDIANSIVQDPERQASIASSGRVEPGTSIFTPKSPGAGAAQLLDEALTDLGTEQLDALANESFAFLQRSSAAQSVRVRAGLALRGAIQDGRLEQAIRAECCRSSNVSTAAEVTFDIREQILASVHNCRCCENLLQQLYKSIHSERHAASTSQQAADAPSLCVKEESPRHCDADDELTVLNSTTFILQERSESTEPMETAESDAMQAPVARAAEYSEEQLAMYSASELVNSASDSLVERDSSARTVLPPSRMWSPISGQADVDQDPEFAPLEQSQDALPATQGQQSVKEEPASEEASAPSEAPLAQPTVEETTLLPRVLSTSTNESTEKEEATEEQEQSPKETLESIEKLMELSKSTEESLQQEDTTEEQERAPKETLLSIEEPIAKHETLDQEKAAPTEALVTPAHKDTTFEEELLTPKEAWASSEEVAALDMLADKKQQAPSIASASADMAGEKDETVEEDESVAKDVLTSMANSAIQEIAYLETYEQSAAEAEKKADEATAKLAEVEAALAAALAAEKKAEQIAAEAQKRIDETSAKLVDTEAALAAAVAAKERSDQNAAEVEQRAETWLSDMEAALAAAVAARERAESPQQKEPATMEEEESVAELASMSIQEPAEKEESVDMKNQAPQDAAQQRKVHLKDETDETAHQTIAEEHEVPIEAATLEGHDAWAAAVFKKLAAETVVGGCARTTMSKPLSPSAIARAFDFRCNIPSPCGSQDSLELQKIPGAGFRLTPGRSRNPQAAVTAMRCRSAVPQLDMTQVKTEDDSDDDSIILSQKFTKPAVSKAAVPQLNMSLVDTDGGLFAGASGSTQINSQSPSLISIPFTWQSPDTEHGQHTDDAYNQDPAPEPDTKGYSACSTTDLQQMSFGQKSQQKPFGPNDGSTRRENERSEQTPKHSSAIGIDGGSRRLCSDPGFRLTPELVKHSVHLSPQRSPLKRLPQPSPAKGRDVSPYWQKQIKSRLPIIAASDVTSKAHQLRHSMGTGNFHFRSSWNFDFAGSVIADQKHPPSSPAAVQLPHVPADKLQKRQSHKRQLLRSSSDAEFDTHVHYHLHFHWHVHRRADAARCRSASTPSLPIQGGLGTGLRLVRFA